MKRYKSFGETGHHSSGHSAISPITALPPAQDVPRHIQQQEFQREEAGFNANRAIRNFGDRGGQSVFMEPPPQQQMYMQPQQQQQMYMQPQQQQPMYMPPAPPIQYGQPIYEEEDTCEKIRKHIKKCKKCAKKYRKDNNLYITIIIGLLMFIMFLFTKIIDRLG
jgi:hypothetical protein